MNKTVFYFLVVTISCVGVYLNFTQFHEDIPRGCDEFGYMNQAKAFDEHKVFVSHTERPFLKGLLDTLRHESISEFDMDYMVVPLSYYVIPSTDKIINMYPPGTPYILSCFPIEFRKMIFPLLVIFLFLFIPIVVVNKNHSHTINWFDFSLILFVLIMIQFYPLKTELMRINSLALTFGLLLSAGLVLDSKPLLSCALIAISANFRLINLILLVPVIAFIPLPNFFTKEGLVNFVKLFLQYTFVIFFCITPYLIYVYLLRGNPFLPTYSSADTAINNNGFSNFWFYFDLDQKWFVIHILLLSILFWLTLKEKVTRPVFFKLFLFPIINYLYFVNKLITMNYYPYASAFILLGFCFSEFRKIFVSKAQKKGIVVSCLTFAIVVFGGGIYEYKNNQHQTYLQAKEKYKSLCNYNIIWGDDYPGTSEYVCNNCGFMFYRGTSKSRNIAMHYLRNHKYTQAILLNDNAMNKESIIKEVNTDNLKYHFVNDKFLGEFLVLE